MIPIKNLLLFFSLISQINPWIEHIESIDLGKKAFISSCLKAPEIQISRMVRSWEALPLNGSLKINVYFEFWDFGEGGPFYAGLNRRKTDFQKQRQRGPCQRGRRLKLAGEKRADKVL